MNGCVASAPFLDRCPSSSLNRPWRSHSPYLTGCRPSQQRWNRSCCSTGQRPRATLCRCAGICRGVGGGWEGEIYPGQTLPMLASQYSAEAKHRESVLRQLPTGTVTLLFTDIEGSTQLLHQLGERYANILSEYRRLLRTAFHASGGHEVDTRAMLLFPLHVRPMPSRRRLSSACPQRSCLARRGDGSGAYGLAYR